ncbi:hypothetical protein CP04DC42_0961 [Chlamydia psittaci 04DC42]|uniref:Uncharacterized protein n=1 Tax=Chlamydia psittaci 99DC5 TaxID=1112251 RepID=A0ABP2X5E7_CHLPS|nr:hypothetical protein B595_0593 [Chlamydia psittaci 84/55]AFS20645.1 hypothetical protein B598_0558 [Chlamydia psittaci GR9]AFS21650.1 hypothetical protein B599_0551 [Chlamydia psittaci MN]AFS23761.1 hypothetical protein B601_0559 [Chlamydia psittaci WS/RT/E30]AFS25981.1 hypothetical protein B603_0563 [Chlamydia psittaci WC]AFS26991.1 hypothetical protein B711_0589 [Chlamydia psittaci CP3]ATQ71553.1 uncharacterized protein CHPS25_0533 [Chlamydia psittaci]EPJ13160.1 hypothetical protein CP0
MNPQDIEKFIIRSSIGKIINVIYFNNFNTSREIDPILKKLDLETCLC